MHYVRVTNGVVVDHITFGEPMPPDWDNFDQWIANDEAQIGWLWDGTVFTAPASNEESNPDMVRAQEFANLQVTKDLVDKLRNATPAQIDTWLLNNVTNLAQARAVLGTIIKFLASRL